MAQCIHDTEQNFTKITIKQQLYRKIKVFSSKQIKVLGKQEESVME